MSMDPSFDWLMDTKQKPTRLIEQDIFPIGVIQNLANVGFPQLIWGYKQTFTIIASRCITDQHIWYIYEDLTVKVCLYPRISWEEPNYSPELALSNSTCKM